MQLKLLNTLRLPKRSKPPKPSRTLNQSGFSLLEVLISVIILSFGILGMVGMQAAALQANRDARLQSVAVSFARELAEMMRGNRTIALLPNANPYLVDLTSSPGTPLAAANPSYCLNVAASTTPCVIAGATPLANSTALANAQMTEWLARLDTELPGARVRVCIDSAPFDASGNAAWACTPTGTGANTVVKIGWTRSSTDRTPNNANAIDRASKPSVVFPITPGIV